MENPYVMGHSQAIESPRDLVVIAASAGGFPALIKLIASLPQGFSVPIVVLLHMPSADSHRSILPELLRPHTHLSVKWIEHGESLNSGMIYISPQDVQSRIAMDATFNLQKLVRNVDGRPAADPLFLSAAECFGKHVIGVVLSGYLSDGALGSRDIVNAGGRILVQDENTCLAFSMPKAALRMGIVDFVLPPTAIAHALTAMLMAPGADAWFRVWKN